MNPQFDQIKELHDYLSLYKALTTEPDPDHPNFDESNTLIKVLEELGMGLEANEILRYLHQAGVDFKFLKRITVDYRLKYMIDGRNVGGYYALGNHFIAVNSELLNPEYFSVNKLVHVLIHEAYHAGVIKDLDGVKVKDEALVELVTRRKIKDLFGYVELKSGYTEIVESLETFLGEVPVETIVEQINSDNWTMLDNFLELIVINPLFKSKDLSSLSFESIYSELNNKWNILLKLFPRLINDLEEKGRNPHIEASMNINNYKLDNLLERVAKRLISGEGYILQKILCNQFFGEEDYKNLYDSNYIRNKLNSTGYGYLLDFISIESIKSRLLLAATYDFQKLKVLSTLEI